MRAVANRTPMESMDDDRTTVMSRGLLPFPKRRGAADSEERTTINPPRPSSRPSPIAQIEERTTIGQTFPKSSAQLTALKPTFGHATLLVGTSPRPPRPTKTTPPPAPVTRSTPPPMPLIRAGHDSKTMVAAPRTIPPPPPSATKLHDGFDRRSDIPSEPPSASVFVRDAVPSSPSFSSDAPRPRRDPMLLLAAGLGMLGMIFTLGIVCGLVVSLRGRMAPDATAEQSAPPVVFATAAAAPKIEAPVAPVAVAPAPVAATPLASEPVAARTEVAAKVARTETPKPEAPKPFAATRAPARVAQWTASAADSPRVARAPKAAPAAPAATKKRVAMPSDPDFDAANAANDLARAQLEASLH
jgi:hypothetical protein